MDISLDFVIEFLSQHIPLLKKVGNTSFAGRCIFCLDSRKNPRATRWGLEYKSSDSIFWHCFRCGKSGNFLELYAHLKQLTIQEAAHEVRRLTRSNSLENLKFNTNKSTFHNNKPQVHSQNFNYILQDCTTTPQGHIQTKIYNKFLAFQEDRKIDYPMHFCHKGMFKNRIIIPILNEKNDIIYFQARTLVNAERKYLNPTSPKSHIFFNKQNWNPTQHIIITEGILDALSIGHQGTMCLGAYINDDFIKVILNNSTLPPIIALDNDPPGKAATLKILKESEYSNKLLYCVYNKKETHIKDINELLQHNYNTYDYIVSNSYNDLKARVLLELFSKG